MAWKLLELLEEASVLAGVWDMTVVCDGEGTYEVMERMVDDGYQDRDQWPDGALAPPRGQDSQNVSGRQYRSIDAHIIPYRPYTWRNKSPSDLASKTE